MSVLSQSQEPGASSWIPAWMQRPKHLGHPPLLSQACQQAATTELEQQGLEPEHVWDTATMPDSITSS